MENKDIIKLFFFMQQAKKLTRDERWMILSLINYQTRCGNMDLTKRQEPLLIYPNKMEEWFGIGELEMCSLIDGLSEKYGFFSVGNDNGYMVTINWDKMENFRVNTINEINAAKNGKLNISSDTINELIRNGVLKVDSKGKITVSK